MYDDPRCDLTRLHDATRADLEELAKLLPAPRRFSAALMLELILDRDRERKSWNLPDKPGLPSRQALMRLYKTWRDQGVFEVLADVFHGECELWRARFELLRDSHRAYRAPFVELASPSDETFEELVRQVCEAVRPRYHATSLQATMRYARGLCSGDVISNNVARRRLNVCVSSGWLPSIMCFAGLTELSGDPRTDVVGDLAWLEGRLDRSRTFDERLPSLELERASASVREGLELAWPGKAPLLPFLEVLERVRAERRTLALIDAGSDAVNFAQLRGLLWSLSEQGGWLKIAAYLNGELGAETLREWFHVRYGQPDEAFSGLDAMASSEQRACIAEISQKLGSNKDFSPSVACHLIERVVARRVTGIMPAYMFPELFFFPIPEFEHPRQWTSSMLVGWEKAGTLAKATALIQAWEPSER